MKVSTTLHLREEDEFGLATIEADGGWDDGLVSGDPGPVYSNFRVVSWDGFGPCPDWDDVPSYMKQLVLDRLYLAGHDEALRLEWLQRCTPYVIPEAA